MVDILCAIAYVTLERLSLRGFTPARGTSRSNLIPTLLATSADFRDAMPNIQRARKEEPFFLHPATADEFEQALRNAVRANARSMNDLHDTIGRCMKSLRGDGMECEAALLTMKAFIRELGLKHKRNGSSEAPHSDLLMEQIVRWCIADFYSEA